ncbi:MAG TPA: hydroxyethylthiazole kinase [Firmicutes bacterium]|nr:hydroxyethylthiazole kinase [Bacillota bacterium]
MSNGAGLLKVIREKRPLIHHLTNYVTMNDCAAVTASVGALPVMAEAEEEAEEMVAQAGAAVINTGTLLPWRARSMMLMGKKAREKGIPVVFDPVGAGATTYRTREIKHLLGGIHPAVVRGNAAEIGFLAGMEGAIISGIETLEFVGKPLEAARRLRERLNYDAVIAVTGPVDVVTDGLRVARIFNGHPLLPRVVGSGCMSVSLIACFAAVERDYFVAAAYALACLGLAAERAAEALGGSSFGPLSFKLRFIDELYLLTPETLAEKARMEILPL